MGCQAVKSCAQGPEEVKVENTDPLEVAKKMIRENIKPTGTRIILVSDNLPAYEVLLRAVLDQVILVPVQYAAWDLKCLKMEILQRAGLPEHQFASVGFLDHGAPGEFALLKAVGGGTIDMADFQNATDCPLLTDFFKFIASYVKEPKDAQNWQKDLECRIDLMACDVAKNAAGMDLLTHLEKMTGVNWAASTNKTGCGEGVENGYDWVMETEEGLGSIAGMYFDENKLKKWKHHAGVLQGVAMIGACCAVAATGPVGAAAVTAVAAYGTAETAVDVYNSDSAGEAAGKAGYAAVNKYTGGAFGVANDAYNGDWY